MISLKSPDYLALISKGSIFRTNFNSYLSNGSVYPDTGSESSGVAWPAGVRQLCNAYGTYYPRFCLDANAGGSLPSGSIRHSKQSESGSVDTYSRQPILQIDGRLISTIVGDKQIRLSFDIIYPAGGFKPSQAAGGNLYSGLVSLQGTHLAGWGGGALNNARMAGVRCWVRDISSSTITIAWFYMHNWDTHVNTWYIQNGTYDGVATIPFSPAAGDIVHLDVRFTLASVNTARVTSTVYLVVNGNSITLNGGYMWGGHYDNVNISPASNYNSEYMQAMAPGAAVSAYGSDDYRSTSIIDNIAMIYE